MGFRISGLELEFGIQEDQKGDKIPNPGVAVT